MTSRDRLADVIDMAAWIDSGRAQDVEPNSLPAASFQNGGIALLQDAWATTVDSGGETDARLGHRVATWRRWIRLGCAVLGLFAGALACGVALAYDGQYPVNLLALIGALVLLPLVLLLLAMIGLALRRNVSPRLRLPTLFSNLTDSWMARFGEFFPRRASGVQTFTAWQIASLSNRFYVAFFVGALLTLLFRVAFSDLAFGWSSTLDLDAGAMAAAFGALAAPWSGWLPVAAPDPSLVEASRFYRLDDGTGVVAAERLGDWWPYVVMTLLVWGLLPRLLFGLFCRRRLRRAERALLMDDPRVTALLDRWQRRRAGFDGPAAPSPMPDHMVSRASRRRASARTDGLIIVWNGALTESGRLSAAQWQGALKLGSRDDDDTVRSSLERLGGAERVVIYTKAYDAPVLESLDFFDRVRASVGTQTLIEVVPVGIGEGPPDAGDLDVWDSVIERHGDAGLFVGDGT